MISSVHIATTTVAVHDTSILLAIVTGNITTVTASVVACIGPIDGTAKIFGRIQNFITSIGCFINFFVAPIVDNKLDVGPKFSF